MTQNTAFLSVAQGIRKSLPSGYFVGILLSYLVNGLLVVYFLTPTLGALFGWWPALVLAILGAFVAQYFRALIVLTSQLSPGSQAGVLEKLIIQLVAFGMTVWALVEFYHLVHTLAQADQVLGLFLFGMGVILAGYVLEILFLIKLGTLSRPSQPSRPIFNPGPQEAILDLSDPAPEAQKGNFPPPTGQGPV